MLNVVVGTSLDGATLDAGGRSTLRGLYYILEGA